MPAKSAKDNWDITDEELVMQIRYGNDEALGILYQRFNGLFYTLSFKFLNDNKIPQMYLEDLLDIAIESLFKAVKGYVYGAYSSFRNFWWAITEKNYWNFYRKISETKTLFYDPDFLETIPTVLCDQKELTYDDPLRNYLIKVVEDNKCMFEKKEKDFFSLYLFGYSQEEVMEILNISRSKYYRLKNKVMSKLNKILKSN